MDTMEKIKNIVETNPVVLFMKGSPQFPQCGFSARTVDALKSCNSEFHHVDVYSEPDIRQILPQYSEWPTFPQLYVNGELIGGCDIICEMYEEGELQEVIKAEV